MRDTFNVTFDQIIRVGDYAIKAAESGAITIEEFTQIVDWLVKIGEERIGETI